MNARLKRRLIIMGIAALAVLIVLVALSRWMNGSSTGTVQVGRPSQQTDTTPQPVTLASRYFSVLLPAGFTVRRQAETMSASALYSALATAGEPSEQFAVTLAQLPSGGLADLGNYNLRVTQPSVYQPYTPSDLPSGAKAFRTVDGAPAFTVFWPHGDKYAELAFSTSGGASLEQLDQVYSQVFSSWEWK